MLINAVTTYNNCIKLYSMLISYDNEVIFLFSCPCGISYKLFYYNVALTIYYISIILKREEIPF